jgi:hypothetical protein
MKLYTNKMWLAPNQIFGLGAWLRFYCLIVLANGMYLGEIFAQPHPIQKQIHELEEEIRRFDAETKILKETTIDRARFEEDAVFEAHRKEIARIAAEETECLNNIHATRENLKDSKLVKEERDLLQDHLNYLINTKYPGFAVERKKLEKHRLEWNAEASRRQAMKKEHETRLAERAEQRAKLVDRLDQLNAGKKGPDEEPKPPTAVISGTQNQTSGDFYQDIKSMSTELRKRALEHRLETIKIFEQKMAEREKQIKAAQAELLQIQAMRPFEKIRFDGEVMEAREAARILSNDIAKAIAHVVRNKAACAQDKVKVQFELSKVN